MKHSDNKNKSFSSHQGQQKQPIQGSHQKYEKKQKHHLKGYMYAFAAAFFFSFIAIISKNLLLGGLMPIQLMFYQFTLTLVLLGIWIGIRNPGDLKISKRQLLHLALQGIIGSTGTNFFFYMALGHMSAGLASMLLFLNPVFVTLFFAVTGMRHLKWYNYASVMLAMSGAALVLGILGKAPIAATAIGIVFGLMSSLCYAFFNVFADLKLQTIKPNVINFYTALFGAVISGSVIVSAQIPLTLQLTQVPMIFLLTLCAGILPVIFIFSALKIIGSEKLTVVATIELPITLILAFLFLKEQMNPLQIVGVLLILSATLLLHLHEKH